MFTDAGRRAAAEWVWYARSGGAAVVRSALAPLSWLFARGVSRRNATFDRCVALQAPVPAISIGNLTVGGTGKTPVASWFATRLLERGAKPALVLRGYGDDEWRVHQLLTPAIPVLVNRDRVAAMHDAHGRGADCVVLDDGFQHRRAPRVSDVVLMSADRFAFAVRLLPAGPYRESLAALSRATALIITVKAASPREIEAVCATALAVRPDLPIAVVRLVPYGVRRVVTENGDRSLPDEEHAMEWLRGRRVLLTSAIADADAFERQVVAYGVPLVRHVRFPDHHTFTAADVVRLAEAAQGSSGVVCTLKDAVKLSALWPREAVPLWYVSQTLVVDRGAEVLERECDRVLAARTATVPTAG